MREYKLYKGDCLDIMKDIPDKSIDLILCDLPYGTTACTWDAIIPFEPLWEQYGRVVKDNGTIVLFSSQPFTTKLISSKMDWFRYEWVWQKNNCSNFQLASIQPLKVHESILVFYKDIVQTVFADLLKDVMVKKGITQSELSRLELSKNGNPTGWVSNKLSGKQIPTREQWKKLCDYLGIDDEYDDLLSQMVKHTYNTQATRCSKECSNKRKAGSLGHLGSIADTYEQRYENYPRSIISFDRVSQPLHPTQKPTDLLEYLIKTYTNEGETVLDNCMGSGSTGVACMNTNRDFIGIELDDKYFEIAEKRIAEAKANSAYKRGGFDDLL